ncbi:MAG: phosphoribosylanthranilate isomerase [Vicinamibacterales bacterium]
MTAIKICGITRAEDAHAAMALGATFLGFILWKDSPRHVEFGAAVDIIRTLPSDVGKVAVFVNPSDRDLIDAGNFGFQVAQVYEYTPRTIVANIRVLRAVRLAPGGEGIEPEVPGDETVLLDAHDPVLHGGTGRTVDWPRAKKIAATRRIFLAGGLTPGNVSEAIRLVRPYAVDVASGVEASPGIKDHARLKAFVQAVKETV